MWICTARKQARAGARLSEQPVPDRPEKPAGPRGDRSREELGLREVAKTWWKKDEIPFDFVRRRMSVVLTQLQKEHVLFCKGAVEEMLDICSQVEEEGRAQRFDPELSRQTLELRDRLNEDGLRVVAVGYKNLPTDTPPVTVKDEPNLVFSGFVAFLDPAKETTAEALAPAARPWRDREDPDGRQRDRCPQNLPGCGTGRSAHRHGRGKSRRWMTPALTRSGRTDDDLRQALTHAKSTRCACVEGPWPYRRFHGGRHQ